MDTKDGKISCRLPMVYIDAVDLVQQTEDLPSRSDVVRRALNLYFRKVNLSEGEAALAGMEEDGEVVVVIDRKLREKVDKLLKLGLWQDYEAFINDVIRQYLVSSEIQRMVENARQLNAIL